MAWPLALLTQSVCAHGSVGSPRPRNREDASRGSILYGVKLSSATEGLVAMAVFNQHLCDTSHGNQTELYNEGQCVPNPRNQRRPSYIFSLHPPPGPWIDCTSTNNCSNTGPGNVAGPFAWLSVYPTNSNCATVPLRTYKLNRDTCTQLPVTGDDYWTGGCDGFSCQWFSQGCSLGCASCTGDWRRDRCENGTEVSPTLPSAFRTFNIDGRDPQGDWTRAHPWRSPGKAPVLDACGMAGGSWRNNEPPGGHPPPGHEYGARGSELPSTAPREATLGGTLDVEWAIAANHGGGYSYRLCPRSEPLTERCFEKWPLAFVGMTQRLRLGSGDEVVIPASTLTTGTLPPGSAWRRNPIPACRPYKQTADDDACALGPQFAPPDGCDASCWGSVDDHGANRTLPVIIDTIQLPSTLTPGDYVLGWRWDCEGTAQIWASCIDVHLRAA